MTERKETIDIKSAFGATVMAVTHEHPPRLAANGSLSAACLEEKFELLKEIGDGSFGSVALARVRTAGGHIARRGTMVNVTYLIRVAATYDSLGGY